MCGLLLLMLAILATIFAHLVRSLAETVKAPIKYADDFSELASRGIVVRGPPL